MHFENTTKQNASEMLEFASNLEKVSRLNTQRICFVRSAGPKNNSISYSSTKYTSHSIISSHTAPSPPKTCTDTLLIQCYLIFLERQPRTENNGGLGGWVHVTVQLVQISYPGVWGNFCVEMKTIIFCERVFFSAIESLPIVSQESLKLV